MTVGPGFSPMWPDGSRTRVTRRSRRRESNPRSLAYETSARPHEQHRRSSRGRIRTCIFPVNSRMSSRWTTLEKGDDLVGRLRTHSLVKELEPPRARRGYGTRTRTWIAGFRARCPSIGRCRSRCAGSRTLTDRVRTGCSATELRTLDLRESGGNRTHNRRGKNPLLFLIELPTRHS